MSAVVTPESLLAAARRHLRPGISADQALVLAFAELTESPLDPWSFDDAAVLLRAERLLIEGVRVSDALDTARTEKASFASEGS
jgi:hypothetical protein